MRKMSEPVKYARMSEAQQARWQRESEKKKLRTKQIQNKHPWRQDYPA